ncbi:MAG: KTSC domain-containing protein [Oscillospiraceae bacterium]|nr:KTSC domain-containing protein [Oscillospiraceae bacterium]
MRKSIDGNIIDMDFVSGKTLSTVGYDEEARVLAIEFCRGPVYVYNEVPKSIYDELLKAPLPDDFFEEKIRYAYKNRRVW